jgi:ATP-dependent Clp protease ATP-binding subunit ClpB
MDLGSFSATLTNCIRRAQELAKSYFHAEITPNHFFLTLLRDESGELAAILKQLGKKPEYFEALLADELSKMRKLSTDEVKPVAAPSLQSMLAAAGNKAEKYSDSEVRPEHMLMVFVSKDSPLSEQITRRLDFDEGKIIDAMADMKVVQSIAGTQVNTEDGEPTVGAEGIKYCFDLTEKARKGELDNFFGRQEDIYNISRVLIRRRKNNPILVGPPGVGKSALVEGLALQIVNKQTTPELHDSVILHLDLGQLVAGAKYKGEFEERFNSLVSRLAKGKGNLVLFIDEVHTLVGAGNPAGGMDAANLLKPALARGAFKVIGATTNEEYRKYIEKDKALDRRFQRVMVDEPKFSEAQEILAGVRNAYSKHHSLTIPDNVVDESIRLSQRYIGDRFLPDKAIDLLDEACASFRLNCTRTKNGLEKLKKQADELKALADDKKVGTSDDKLDDTILKSLRTFNDEFEEIFSLWKERVK